MSNAPVFLRSNFTDLFGTTMLPVLEELFRVELMQHPSRRGELFKIVSTERDIWQATEIHDMPLMNQVPEGTDYTFARPNQGANKTLTPAKYGLGFSISEEAVEDGKFDFIADAVRKLARSAMESQEIQAFSVLNNGFSGGSQLSADGLTVFNTAHTLPSGLTFSNTFTTAADLSVSALDQALADFDTNFIGDSGIIYRIPPKVLLVHSSQRRYALELTGSDLKADTSDNNLNSIKADAGLRVISSPHITDAEAWYLMADPMDTGLRIVSRKPIETKAGGPDTGFITDSILYKTRYREAIGVTHAYGVFGTAGV